LKEQEMTISQKWKAAAAGLLALALVGGSAAAAHAAPGDPLNPQTNGSEGGLYIWDGDAETLIADPAHIFDRSDALIGSGSPTDMLAPIPGTPANTGASTQSYTFVSSQAQLRATGKNSWEAYTAGILNPNAGRQITGAYLTPGDQTDYNGPGIDGVFNDIGGTYYLGVAYTRGSGVIVDSVVYRTMTILANNKYTLAPIEVEQEQSIGDPTEGDLVPGLEKADLAATAIDSNVISISAPALAGRTVNVGAFSTYTDLGQVTLDGSGSGTVDVTGKNLAKNLPHKLVLWDPSNGDVLSWGSFTLTTLEPTASGDTVNLTATVTASGEFSINANNTTVDLGTAGRNVETAEVLLGGFTVIDDRNQLLGWDVNVSAAPFASGANTIAAEALGYKVTRTGGVGVATLGADKAAGDGSFGTVASALAGASTTAAGADFDLGLSFKSPVDAAAGQYTSTLTLDLVSK
jgi:hypothetical protein